MAKLVDAQDLKSCFRKEMRVRFPPAARFFGAWPSWFKAPALGAGDPEFESRRPDKTIINYKLIVDSL